MADSVIPVLPAFYISPEQYAINLQIMKDLGLINDADAVLYYTNLQNAINTNAFGYGILGNLINYNPSNESGLLAIVSNGQYVKNNINNFATLLLFGLGLGALEQGVTKAVNYAYTPKVIGKGAEQIVYRPHLFASNVEKVGLDEATAAELNNLHGAYFPLRNTGRTMNLHGTDIPVFSQLKVTPISKKELSNAFTYIDPRMRRNGYYRMIAEDGTWYYYNPRTNMVFTDIELNIGRIGSKYGFFDGGLLPHNDFLSFFKKGGKMNIILQFRKYRKGGIINKFDLGGDLETSVNNKYIRKFAKYIENNLEREELTIPNYDYNSLNMLDDIFTTYKKKSTKKESPLSKQETTLIPWMPLIDRTISTYPSETTSYVDSDLIKIDIEDLLKSEGITSINGKAIKFGSKELRPDDASYGSKDSHHKHRDPHTGNASARDISIEGGDFKDYADFRQKLLSNPRITLYMAAKGWGIINELTPQAWAISKGRGLHFHFGPDLWAQRTWKAWLDDPNIDITKIFS